MLEKNRVRRAQTQTYTYYTCLDSSANTAKSTKKKKSRRLVVVVFLEQAFAGHTETRTGRTWGSVQVDTYLCTLPERRENETHSRVEIIDACL